MELSRLAAERLVQRLNAAAIAGTSQLSVSGMSAIVLSPSHPNPLVTCPLGRGPANQQDHNRAPKKHFAQKFVFRIPTSISHGLFPVLITIPVTALSYTP